MTKETTRNLMRDFSEEGRDIPRAGDTRQLGPGNGGLNIGLQQSQSSPRLGAISEPVMTRLQQILNQAAASSHPGVPPTTPAAIINTLSQFGLTVVTTTQPTSSPTEPSPDLTHFITIVEKTKQGPVDEARSQKRKQVPEKGYESARDDTASSEEGDEHPEEIARREADLREERIQSRLKEYEQALRKQEVAEKSEKRGTMEPARSEKRVAPRAVIIDDRMHSSKRRYVEGRKEETRKSPREKVTSTMWTPPRLRHSPFVQEILSDPLPANYKSVGLEYDGTDDPSIHMARFEGLVTLHQYSEGVKCRIFSITLVGVAQQWFQQLEENSITSFEDLYDLFMRQFVSSRRATRSAMSLMDMRQEPGEGLREYLARFNKVSLEVSEAETQLKLHAFTKGLKPGPLFDSLQVEEAKTYEDLLLRVPGYIHLEEAKAARRARQEK